MRPRRRRLARLRRAGRPAPRPRALLIRQPWCAAGPLPAGMNHFDDLLQAIGEKLIDAGVKAIEAGVARADVRAGQLVAMGDLPGIYPSNISESETGFVATSDAVFLDGGFVVLAKSGGVS